MSAFPFDIADEVPPLPQMAPSFFPPRPAPFSRTNVLRSSQPPFAQAPLRFPDPSEFPTGLERLETLPGTTMATSPPVRRQPPVRTSIPLPGAAGRVSAVNVVSPLQRMIDEERAQQAQRTRVSQSRAQASAVTASRAAARQGQFIDRAIAEQRAGFSAATDVLRNLMSDPFLASLMRTAQQRVEQPGLAPGVVSGIRGAAAARSAASQSAQQRQVSLNLSARGVGGAQREFLLSSLRNRSGANLSRQLSGIDIEAAQFATQQQGQAISQAQSLFAQRAGIGSQLASTLRGFNPLASLLQAQQIQSPFSSIGASIGALGG